MRSVSFSGDGTRIVSGSDDKTVMVWDAVSGTLQNAGGAQEFGDTRYRFLGTGRASCPGLTTTPCGCGTQSLELLHER